MMRKIFLLLIISAFAFSCTNQDIEFDDNEFNAVYFPYQMPLRTIMLGDEVVGDNTIDLEHAFSVGAAIGGMFQNVADREVSIELAPELVENVVSENGDTLEILPQAYYNATFDKITIPAGSFNGKLRVDLKDAFFNDPKSIGLNYVIPLRIIDADADSVLVGKPVELDATPDPRIPDLWEITPKNYTLFGIKYINPYHGVYLLRGKTVNTTDASADDVVYSTRFLTDNSTVKLTSKSLTESVMSIVGGTKTEGIYNAMLTFDESNKSIVVSQTNESSIVISGTGIYFTKDDDKSEGYNEKKHRTIYLDYTYEDAGNTFHAMDSLVFVDTDMTFEEFKISVTE